MRDKVGAQDKISFVLNGKPIEPKAKDYCRNHTAPGGCQLHNVQCGWPKCNEPPEPTFICWSCGVDRFKSPCPRLDGACHFKGTTS